MCVCVDIYVYICRYICMNDPNHAYDTMIQTLFILIYLKKNQINFLNKIHLLIELDAKKIPLEAQKSMPIPVQSQQ